MRASRLLPTCRSQIWSALIPARNWATSVLPTVASFLPGYEAASSFGILGPEKTPEAVIRRINQEVVRFLQTPEAKERLFSLGADTIGSTPEEFAAAIKAEVALLGKVIRDAGIRAD